MAPTILRTAKQFVNIGDVPLTNIPALMFRAKVSKKDAKRKHKVSTKKAYISIRKHKVSKKKAIRKQLESKN
ncbi:hypothetical protein [Pantoea sp. CFSAN033090]|uniref:hypothetical protein n=1 Tax=Pantoea sp. CFSAN033090 TaxID=1690502 RepID=UPI0012E17E0A|nr:hypothetical protein [Pantoea sp. CFSAN033090]